MHLARARCALSDSVLAATNMPVSALSIRNQYHEHTFAKVVRYDPWARA